MPVFLRDDDAGWADGRLLALLDVLSASSPPRPDPGRGVPVDVAVIPDAVGPALARELLARPGIGLHQLHQLAAAASVPAAVVLEAMAGRR